MSLRKALSPIVFIAASLFGLSSVASASMLNIIVETNYYDSISVDGFFNLDTTNPESWEVTDWSLNVTLQEDPAFTMTNSMATADAAGSAVSFIANDPLGVCDMNMQQCLTRVDFTFQPFGNIGQTTQLTATSVCVTLASVTFAPNQVCNIDTASVLFTASPVAVAAVPEPTALALFGIGMLVIYPIQRRLYR